MKEFRFWIYTVITLIFLSPVIGLSSSVKSVEKNAVWRNDTIIIPNISIGDSSAYLAGIPVFSDSAFVKRMENDTINVSDTIPPKKDALDARVDFVAKDSMIYTGGNWGFLYGDGEVYYKEISLKAENISMSMDSSIVHATFGVDSAGVEFGYPLFSDNGTDYEAKSMRYNFRTKKGYSLHTITQQGEGFIVAERAKKNPDDSFFMCDGRYTTCDQHDHPHFYLMLTKAKVRPQKDVITGPAYLVIEDVPLPIGLPFAFFPFTSKYSSGIIMPSLADEMDRGFGLYDGGYYFAISEYVDLAVTGEIFTKGSWGLAAKANYKKRYRYSGDFYTNYISTKYGDKDDPDYSKMESFSVKWTHRQDPKANMYRTLSASVNFSTSNYNTNSIREYYGGNTENTKSSTVSMTQKFPNSPFTITGNMSIAQVSRDTTISMTFPNLTVAMSRVYPFKRKEAVGEEQWYEKIQLSYTGDFRNSITTKERDFLKSSLKKDLVKGMKHTVPVSATFNIFNYLNVTPSFNYTEYWYFQRVTQRYDAAIGNNVSADTTYSFRRLPEFNYSLSLQTKVYGFFEPIFKIGSIQRIRHVFTPSITFSGRPDFSDPIWGVYESYQYYDANGILQTHKYSPYRGGMFGVPTEGKQGNIGFSFDNNIEMKVGAPGDSTRIISLIDNLGIRFSYNMMADEFKWSEIATNIRLKLSRNLTVNLNANFEPYMYDLNEQGGLVRVNKLRISNGKGIARLRSTSYSISPSINQDTFKKWFGGGGDTSTEENNPELGLEGEEGDEEQERTSLFARKESSNEYDDDGYLKSEFKWSVTANYSFNYDFDRSRVDYKKREFKHKLTHNLGFNVSIQPTKNWNFNLTTNYDFEYKKFSYMNCSLTRDLHCWSISASFIPVGPHTSYFVTLRANSSMLQDLKYEQKGRPSSFDPEWY